MFLFELSPHLEHSLVKRCREPVTRIAFRDIFQVGDKNHLSSHGVPGEFNYLALQSESMGQRLPGQGFYTMLTTTELSLTSRVQVESTLTRH